MGDGAFRSFVSINLEALHVNGLLMMEENTSMVSLMDFFTPPPETLRTTPYNCEKPFGGPSSPTLSIEKPLRSLRLGS